MNSNTYKLSESVKAQSNYPYKVIVDDLLQNGPGNGEQTPSMVVVHHSAVVTEGDYDIHSRLNLYATNHIERIGNPGLAYHFFIPRLENDNNIYITRYTNQSQWHCSNIDFNLDSIGILLDGDFTQQTPLDIQLKKLKQLLDDLADQYFVNAPEWQNDSLRLLNPKDNSTLRKGGGVEVTGGVFGHIEVTTPGFGTACPGSLLDYVVDYRNTQGNVTWGAVEERPQLPPVENDGVYRFWSSEYKKHFFTANIEERNFIIENWLNWSYEGVAFYTYPKTFVPVHRFYRESNQAHFYTASEKEKEKILTSMPEWQYEGVAFYCETAKSPINKPVFRFWSDEYQSHFFTTNPKEKDFIIKNYGSRTWNYEGIAFYMK